MPRLTRSVPKYRLHKPSGQAVVTLRGKDYYLGPHGTPESWAEYDRLIAEYLAGGRHTPSQPMASKGALPAGDPTVDELFLRYWESHVVSYYRKQGQPTSEQVNIRKAMRPLVELYGHTSACQFGPLALKAYRQQLIDLGRARTAINCDVGRVKRMFKWGGENEIVSPQIYQNLRCIAGLRRGRSEAVESAPVKPAPDDQIEAVLNHVSPQVATMIELQRLSGMRPGEVVIMRRC